jgi:hypothetical protein
MSNPTITPQRIRLLIDKNNMLGTLMNVLTSADVQLINSNGIQFELMVYDSAAGVFSDYTTVDDWSNVSSLVISLQNQKDPHNAVVYWTTSVPVGSVNTMCTAENWANGTDQQVLATVSGTTNSIYVGQPYVNAWLCIYVVSTGITPSTYCLSAFPLNVWDAGVPGSLNQFNLQGPDNLSHTISLVKDANGNFVLSVDQVGTSSNTLVAPFLTGPGIFYLVGPDNLQHAVSIDVDANGNFVLAVEQVATGNY